MTAPLTALVLSALIQTAAQTFAPDAEGFIRNWLVLAPMAIDGDSGADQIDREFVREVTLKPKAEDKVSFGGKELAWKAHQTSDYFIDFLQSFGKERGEHVVGYALAYVIADEDMKVSLLLSTNDQGKGVAQRARDLPVCRDARARQGHGPRRGDPDQGSERPALSR